MAALIKYKWLKYVLSGVLISIFFLFYLIITVGGEATNPRFVLMRLEDIGPGGQYETMEELGKLRTVLEYLRDQQVIYHLAVIPRWISMPADGSRYDISLDQTDNPYVASFQKLLRDAVSNGATLGMHGYTHQIGNVRRDDGHQDSGIGNEFNNPGSPETMSAAFAEPRLKEGLAIFKRLGMRPQFWESPHYRSTPEQDELFRNYFGLNYQADVQTDRNTPVAQYANKRNSGYGQSSMGAVYVPTPFDYIPSNKDEKLILDRVGKSNITPSFFFHPFLEFKQLVPVLDDSGEQAVRDGLPEFRYISSDKSLLQKLVIGLKAKRYSFFSIQDYVPFTPSHSVKLNQAVKDKLMLGDVTGDGQADRVAWDSKSGLITVAAGAFSGMRNETQGLPAVWANAAYQEGSAATLGGRGVNGVSDLWISQPSGKLERFAAEKDRFALKGSWTTEPRKCNELYVMPQAGGDVVVAGLTADKMEIFGYQISKDSIKPLKSYKFTNIFKNDLQLRKRDNGDTVLFSSRSGANRGIEWEPNLATMEWVQHKQDLGIPNEDGFLRFSDYNGDGKPDILRWNPSTLRYSVYLNNGTDGYSLLSTFGPWGKPGAKLLVADLDGNGKGDLALIDRAEGYIDTALSFESSHVQLPRQ
jgi:predicted deacetylase